MIRRALCQPHSSMNTAKSRDFQKRAAEVLSRHFGANFRIGYSVPILSRHSVAPRRRCIFVDVETTKFRYLCVDGTFT